MFKRSLVALLALTVTGSGLAGVGPAEAAVSPYENYVNYGVNSALGAHDAKCGMTAHVDQPYRGSGPDSGRAGSATSSFDLTEDSTGKVVASFATQSSFRSGMTRRADRSLYGSAVFTGKATVTGKAANVCHGVGETSLSYGKLVRVPATGVFRLSGTFDDFYHYSVFVAAYAPNAAGEPDADREREIFSDSSFWDYDTTTPDPRDRKVVQLTRSFPVTKGEFVFLGVNTDVFAQYHSIAENGDGGAWLSYAYRPDGNQVRPTPRKVARLVKLPVNLNCATRKFKFKPRKAGRIRQATLFVNGKKVTTINRVRKVHKVRIKKGKAITRIKLRLAYDSGSKKSVKKAYYGC
jgi:hypothetical protein